MDIDLLDLLQCPFCGGRFAVAALDRRGNELRHGLLCCACDRYPVVSGIPVLRKDRQALLAEVRGALSRGRPEDAFLALVGRPLPHELEDVVKPPVARRALRHLHQRLRRPRFAGLGPATSFGEGGDATAVELLALYCDNSPEDFYYNAFRFGQPRHLVALALATLTRRRTGPVLDLACGCGHVAFSLREMSPCQPLVGTDTFFFGLWLASRRLAPGATFLCCSAGDPFPFAGNLFAAAVCVDSFHYFHNKAGAARELARVVEPRGLMVLTGMHNRHFERALQFGQPLAPEEYARLFAGLPRRLLADDRILERYLAGAGPDLSRSEEEQDLDRAPLLSLVAAREASALPGAVELPDPPPHRLGPPAWNPLYARRRCGEEIELSLHVPSAAFAADQGESWRYLAPSLRVPADVDDGIRQGEWTDRLCRLADRFVVLAMPPGFSAPSAPEDPRSSSLIPSLPGIDWRGTSRAAAFQPTAEKPWRHPRLALAPA